MKKLTITVSAAIITTASSSSVCFFATSRALLVATSLIYSEGGRVVFGINSSLKGEGSTVKLKPCCCFVKNFQFF